MIDLRNLHIMNHVPAEITKLKSAMEILHLENSELRQNYADQRLIIWFLGSVIAVGILAFIVVANSKGNEKAPALAKENPIPELPNQNVNVTPEPNPA